ncbi:MAG: prepilin-type N-terminal cleavage/methylation domain-containing protein [Synergistaceae bacterium]|nr:prepilin-type N-terminal cleavage/methylation domain-containing protein [Synergistaceae bacterium]
MKRNGFTLIEILIVLTIVGMLASVMLPRLSFYFEPPSAVLQRSIEEATDLALSGTPIRFSVKKEGQSRRGEITSEVLKQREVPEDSLSAFLGTNINKPVILEWQKVKLRSLPEGSGWRFNPEVIYFYSDGSCTPARISWAGRDTRESEAEEYILTVTGYCAKLEKQ